MTNFEKWKAEVPLEEVAALYEDHCVGCPAEGACEYEDGYKYCNERFMAWANAEAAE